MSTPGGRIVNIQNFSIHDGPGIRTTVFFKGCPLRCLWCANPETQKREIELIHVRSQCIGCGQCAEHCPDGLISLENALTIKRDRCKLCGACLDVCPGGAMRLVGRDASLEEVLEEIEKEMLLNRNSGGGVTLSGGEPLMQPDFAKALLVACKRWGVNTAIETCGHAPYETLREILELVDTVYFDLKKIDQAGHKTYTNVDNQLILNNLAQISKIKPGIIVRIPIIPGINDSEDDVASFGKYLVEQTAVTSVELMNYHKLGEHKYTNLGRPYGLEQIIPLSREVFAEFCINFSQRFGTLNLSYHV